MRWANVLVRGLRILFPAHTGVLKEVQEPERGTLEVILGLGEVVSFVPSVACQRERCFLRTPRHHTLASGHGSSVLSSQHYY